jgi:hypothetical protein
VVRGAARVGPARVDGFFIFISKLEEIRMSSSNGVVGRGGFTTNFVPKPTELSQKSGGNPVEERGDPEAAAAVKKRIESFDQFNNFSSAAFKVV